MSNESVPLFPLNTVLFPRMPLPLHIFEDRYKVMIANCLEQERPFGVLLIQDGVEAGGLAVPERIGTLANIRAVEPLEDGCMNLLAEGSQRFRLLESADGVKPYLVGTVEIVKDHSDVAVDLNPLRARIAMQFREYFDILMAHAGVDMPEYELPKDPEELSFVIAAVVESNLAARQNLLEITDTGMRLGIEIDLLESELSNLRRAQLNVENHVQKISEQLSQSYLSRN